jgi:hypothetical protein
MLATTGDHTRNILDEEGAVAAEMGGQLQQSALGELEPTGVMDGPKGEGAVCTSTPQSASHGQDLVKQQVQSRKLVPLRQQRMCPHHQVVLDGPWDVQPRERGPQRASRNLWVHHHFEDVRPCKRQENALKCMESVGTSTEDVEAEIEFGRGEEDHVRN